ncbi:beta-eliminating lyase-related protein [Bacillus sp. ISL-55]|uniref:threonine aldolase family protein n=1 Tax=Bacillus sp. ISL-55 TaxID=2819134 RepID=UPI001BEB85BB|nr:beta-eliminating lyase-related protein [Bacillus sp. ISL-55]MBT2695508.1 DegT/DnrJ/EryC1/StrS family aminotransferase [Bacillus sp. ISL-55]
MISALQEAFDKSTYPLPGHGRRNVQVLKDAFENIDGQLDSDIYGTGKVIDAFQDKIAAFLGKEKAVFFPSGTMAQQIAMRIWCDEKELQTVAYHPLSHLEIHEEDGLKELHNIKTILIADETRVIELDDVVSMDEDVACLLLELPQREIGGQLPSYETLVEISKHCRKNGIKLHLDGARLLEVLPFYEKAASEVCELFDSVYLSFYKGIGGIAGAILAGEAGFISESKVWKRRYGGDLISLYPYIISADHYFDQKSHKMPEYYENAKELAGFYNSCHNVTTLPQIPVSNMFHVHFPHSKEKIETILVEVIRETGVGIINHLKATGESSCYFEVSIGDRYQEIPKTAVKNAFLQLDRLMKKKFSY